MFERMFHGVRMRIGRFVTYVKEHMKKNTPFKSMTDQNCVLL